MEKAEQPNAGWTNDSSTGATANTQGRTEQAQENPPKKDGERRVTKKGQAIAGVTSVGGRKASGILQQWRGHRIQNQLRAREATATVESHHKNR
ncbi:hypothetical protein BS78_09G072200 [Paspalum vaginatum]|nr:hypothetical protein BS78_09G072200 [Paspalum vaginatum]